MARHLIVTQAFDGREVGARIEDPSEVAAALESNAHHVVAVEAPEPKKAKADKSD